MEGSSDATLHKGGIMMETEEKPLKKDKECMHCESFFSCKGKPRDVEQCLLFKERKKKNGCK